MGRRVEGGSAWGTGRRGGVAGSQAPQLGRGTALGQRAARIASRCNTTAAIRNGLPRRLPGSLIGAQEVDRAVVFLASDGSGLMAGSAANHDRSIGSAYDASFQPAAL